MAASSKKYHVASLCAILAVGMTGCDSSSTTEASTSDALTITPHESATPTDEPEGLNEVYPADLSITELGSLGEHLELDDLVEAWEHATDEVCTADTGSGKEFESEFVRCDGSSVLLVFPSTTKVKGQLDYVDKIHRETHGPDSQLAGQNWIANVDNDLIPALHQEIGGVKVQLGY